MHRVTVLAMEGFVIFDLAIAVDMFSRAKSRTGMDLYETYVCGNSKSVKGHLFDLHLRDNLSILQQSDTIIVPGVSDVQKPSEPTLLDALRKASDKGARIASICSGAFVLAEAGLLDGLRATTHWRGAEELAARYPRVQVEADVLFIDNGKILTSAGVASGIDLCLHIIRRDHGAVAAADVADNIVMPLERTGIHSQRIKHDVTGSSAMQDILLWITENLNQDLGLEQIAEHFNLTSRTLGRWFREHTGITALQWILAAKIRRSQQLLETTDLSVEDVAAGAGFSSASAFRDRFHRITGASPTTWRKTYRGLHNK